MSFIRPRNDMISVLGSLGLMPSLKLCLDAGDDLSWTGSGGQWFDRSGLGFDFFLGTTSAVEANDPTFNGVIGRRSDADYFSMDGNDRFYYETNSDPWMQNVHKDNAKFAITNWVYRPAAGNVGRMFATSAGNATDVGIEFAMLSAPSIELSVRKGAAPAALGASQAVTMALSAWHFAAVSIDESTGFGLFQLNGTQYSFNSTYLTPNTVGASSRPILYNDFNGSLPASAGSRTGNMCAWEGRALASEELMAFYYATRGKYGV